MFLGGLWHGAGWSYAVWGIFHGIALRGVIDHGRKRRDRALTGHGLDLEGGVGVGNREELRLAGVDLGLRVRPDEHGLLS